MYAERWTHAQQTLYAEMEVPPGWPMVVRERAVEIADPPTDPEDEIFLLGERCARAYMQADALHYRAMKLLAEFDRRSGWEGTAFSSTAEWLAWRIGIKPGAARERLRTALALETLPLTSEAMKNGELSFTKVRALTRVARPDNETALLLRPGGIGSQSRACGPWLEGAGPQE